MTHPLVTQLRFARREFYRCIEGISAEDAMRRLEPLNALSWTVGHLANHEHYLWVRLAQGQDNAPELHKLAGYGSPPSAPPWDEMLTLWGQISAAADRYLGTLTEENIGQHLSWQGKPRPESIGKSLLRNTYHIWFHLGEAHAIRQMLGHSNLPDFVGDMSEVHYS